MKLITETIFCTWKWIQRIFLLWFRISDHWRKVFWRHWSVQNTFDVIDNFSLNRNVLLICLIFLWCFDEIFLHFQLVNDQTEQLFYYRKVWFPVRFEFEFNDKSSSSIRVRFKFGSSSVRWNQKVRNSIIHYFQL